MNASSAESPAIPRARDRDVGVKRHQRGRPVTRRVGMRQASSDSPAIANLHVSGQIGGVEHERQMLLDERRSGDVSMPAERAHRQPIVDSAQARQTVDPVDVDQVARAGDPQLHHRDEALPSRENLGLLAVLDEQLQRLVHGARCEIFEFRGVHLQLPAGPLAAPALLQQATETQRHRGKQIESSLRLCASVARNHYENRRLQPHRHAQISRGRLKIAPPQMRLQDQERVMPALFDLDARFRAMDTAGEGYMQILNDSQSPRRDHRRTRPTRSSCRGSPTTRWRSSSRGIRTDSSAPPRACR